MPSERAGTIPAALVALERALTLAEPEGYVRTFVDEGPPMAALLEAAAKRGVVPDYARRLLTAFGKPGRTRGQHACEAGPWSSH